MTPPESYLLLHCNIASSPLFAASPIQIVFFVRPLVHLIVTSCLIIPDNIQLNLSNQIILLNHIAPPFFVLHYSLQS